MTLFISSWAVNLEEGARAQAEALAELPFLFSHVALMADAHQGYGMPIGGVIAAEDVVVPNAVGVDIGCGMHLVMTDIPAGDVTKEDLLEICRRIRLTVPTGFHKHTQATWSLPPNMPMIPVLVENRDNAEHSLGTLGGGNHFIEIQRNVENNLCFMIHSGSRNLGKQICDTYNSRAKRENAQWLSSVDPKTDLAFLPVSTQFGQEYLACMAYAVQYAKLNRVRIATAVGTAITEVLSVQNIPGYTAIDCCHNYAALEHHMGRNVWVHRKGAIKAFKGDVGIIPGSQGTCSYKTEGLGDPMSFMSSSHGAGRRMGRKQAQRELSLEEEIARMDAQGIVHSMSSKESLDEAAGAYKDIDEVMEAQKRLCRITDKLTPLAVVKG